MATTANRTNTVLLGIVAAILIGWVLKAGAAILVPLVIAFLLASMLQPIVRGLSRKGVPPALTVMLIVWLLFLGLVQGGLLVGLNVQAFISGGPTAEIDPVGPDSQGEVSEASGGWKGIRKNIGVRLDNSKLPEAFKTYIKEALESVDLNALAPDLALGGIGFIATVVLILIYMVFIFAEQAVFRRKILSIAGDRRDEAAQVLETIGRGISRYLGVKTVVSLLTGALCYLVLAALTVPWALLWAFLTFMLNYIPTFGSIIAGIFPTITVLADSGSWGKALVVIATYLAVNLTLGSFIEPRILGHELNLSPLVVVVSVVVWAGLWGIVGGFLAVPLTAALQICLASQETTRPIAIMLGSGPPRGRRRTRRRGPDGGEEPSSEAAA